MAFFDAYRGANNEKQYACKAYTGGGNTSTDKIICCEIGRLFDRLSDYLYLYDMDKGTVFYGVFCLVFLNGENESYEEIASRLHVASRTVDRYVKSCNVFAKKLIAVEYPLLKKYDSP